MFRQSKEQFHAYLVQCSNTYYTSGQTQLTDAAFDALVEEYETTYNTTFTHLGVAHHAKCTLPICMGSLSKCKEEVSLRRFASTPSENTTKGDFVFSEKLDGISVLIVSSVGAQSVNRKLYTRGDGTVGCDVSHIADYIQMPSMQSLHNLHALTKQSIVYLRGEVLFPKQLATVIGENLRNIVCGAVNAKTLDVQLLQQAVFVAYAMPHVAEKWYKPSEQFALLHQCGIKTPLFTMKQECNVAVCNQVLDDMLATTQFCIDGVVIARDVYEPTLSADNPKCSCAFKRLGNVQQATVVNVHWALSRYGVYHPTVEITPVVFDGCTISKASGFNAQYIFQQRINIGSIVEITRSGDVIPHIVRVVQPSATPLMPSGRCKWKGVDVCIDDGVQNDDVAKSQLVYVCKVLKIKGVSEGVINKLFDAGITTLEQLFSIDANRVSQIHGLGPTSAAKIVTEIQAARARITLVDILLLSACFPQFGERKLTAICDAIDVVTLLTAASFEETTCVVIMKALHTIGVKTQASVFIEGCKQIRSNPYLLQLLHEQKSQSKVVDGSKSTSSDGQKSRVVFSGFRDKALAARCAEQNIEVVDNVTKTTLCVVVIDTTSTSSKVQAAQKFGIPIRAKDEFIASLS